MEPWAVAQDPPGVPYYDMNFVGDASPSEFDVPPSSSHPSSDHQPLTDTPDDPPDVPDDSIIDLANESDHSSENEEEEAPSSPTSQS